MGLILRKEAAKRLGVAESTIRNWVSRGILKTLKVNDVNYIDEDTINAIFDTQQDINKLLEERKQTLSSLNEEIADIRREANFNRLIVRTAINSLMNLLDNDIFLDREKTIFHLILEGARYDEIQEATLLSKARILQIFDKILRKIETKSEHYSSLLKENERLKEKQEMLEILIEDKNKIIEGLSEQLKIKNSDNTEDPIRGIKVEDLEMSIRAYNCLKAADIKTLGQLADHTTSELLKLRSLGRKTLSELDDLLYDYGLKFKDSK